MGVGKHVESWIPSMLCVSPLAAYAQLGFCFIRGGMNWLTCTFAITVSCTSLSMRYAFLCTDRPVRSHHASR